MRRRERVLARIGELPPNTSAGGPRVHTRWRGDHHHEGRLPPGHVETLAVLRWVAAASCVAALQVSAPPLAATSQAELSATAKSRADCRHELLPQTRAAPQGDAS
jgi:hypothetical protein